MASAQSITTPPTPSQLPQFEKETESKINAFSVSIDNNSKKAHLPPPKKSLSSFQLYPIQRGNTFSLSKMKRGNRFLFRQHIIWHLTRSRYNAVDASFSPHPRKEKMQCVFCARSCVGCSRRRVGNEQTRGVDLAPPPKNIDSGIYYMALFRACPPPFP